MTSGTEESGAVAGSHYRYRSWSGTDYPAPGEHSYTYRVRESFYPPIQILIRKTWYPDTMLTFSPRIPQDSTDRTDALINCCTAKVWQDLIQSRFNAGIFAGEFKESYVMVCDIVTAIARSIYHAKHGRYRHAFRTLGLAENLRESTVSGNLANLYMMWHFGIYPMMQDIAGLYDLMTHTYQVVKRVRRHCVYRDSGTRTSQGVVWQWQKKAICEIRGEVKMLELSYMDRLGLNDLPTIAWELTKLSWMLDWLLPIGNFLSAANAHNRTSGQSFFMTRMQKERLDNPFNTGAISIKGFDKSSFDEYYPPGPGNSRASLTALPWSFPTISNPLGDNLSRWVTSVAFLRQSIGR